MLLTGEHFLELVKKNKKLSETIIPELIHRLVRETINSGAYTHFPANDDVFTPGFDGVITGNTIEHRFLPLGNLFFEMGAKKDCYKGITKIDSDYQKRKNDESITDKNKEVSFLEIQEINSTPRIYELDKIDILMIKELS